MNITCKYLTFSPLQELICTCKYLIQLNMQVPGIPDLKSVVSEPGLFCGRMQVTLEFSGGAELLVDKVPLTGFWTTFI